MHAIIISILAGLAPATQYRGPGGGGWHHMPGFGWGGGWITWIVIIAVVTGLVIWAVRRGSAREEHRFGDRALDILKERYAKGEIDKEEFDRMKKDLQQ
jgi:putative membrane protein